jgi:hypothetical protein
MERLAWAKEKGEMATEIVTLKGKLEVRASSLAGASERRRRR